MEKQNKFCTKKRTKILIGLGFTPIDKKGFQIHELINSIPKEIFFIKTFIDWKRKTQFFPRLYSYYWGSWCYDLIKLKKTDRSDQGQSRDQLVDLLAEMAIYIIRNQIKKQKRRDNGKSNCEEK